MTDKKNKSVYKSFEELRADLFPKLVDKEKMDKIKQDAKQYGSYLADKSVDRILKESPAR